MDAGQQKYDIEVKDVEKAPKECICGPILRELACLVTGNYGRWMAESLGVPDDRTVNVSNFIGESLGIVDELGFETLIVIGQVGKFAKLFAGSLDTHSAKSDGRLEALAAFSALHGAAQGDVRRILQNRLAAGKERAAVGLVQTVTLLNLS